MRRIVFMALLVLFAALSLPARAGEGRDGPEDCKPAPIAQLPMTLKYGHVTVPASVNGKEVTFGIDTGGPFSSLTLAAAHRVGNVGHRDDVRIGDVELSRVYMAWMDSFPGVDGLIAPDVLSRYDAEFDFGDNMFRLFEPRACADRAAYGSGAVIPFTLAGDGHVRIAVTLDGRKIYAILDTGSPISILSMRDAKSLFAITRDSADIKAARTTVSGLWNNAFLANYTYGVWDYPSKAVKAYTYPFKTIAMGAMSLADPPIELTEGRNFLGSDFATLLLGNDVLSRFRLTIAYREQKLYIADAGAP